MTDKTQPTAHAEITAPISADLRRIDDAGVKSASITLMTEDRACTWAWDQVREDVGTKGWTAGDSCNFYGFFLWGWNYRGQYEAQRPAAPPAPAAVAVTDEREQFEAWAKPRWPDPADWEQAIARPKGVVNNYILHGEWLGWQARAALAAAPAQARAGITVDFKQATELLAMFGGEPAEITLIEGPGHRGEGLYAYYSDLPEEGAEFLGKPDNEALPAAPAQPAAWMTPEGDRVVTETTMASARKDGGAMLSSLRPFTVALARVASPAQAVAVPITTPRFAAWTQLRDTGFWPDGVPDWARDATGRMHDMTAAKAVISELHEAVRSLATAPAQEHATQLAGQAVSMSHREWRFALQEAIETMDAEIDSRGDERNVRRMKRAKAVLSTMLAAAPAQAQEDAAAMEAPAAPEWERVRRGLSMMMMGFASTPGKPLHAAEAALDAATEPGMPLSCLRALAAAPRAPAVDALDHAELQEIQRAVEQFADCGETDVDYALLMRAAQAGYLECTHFQVMNESALNLDAASAAQGGAKP